MFAVAVLERHMRHPAEHAQETVSFFVFVLPVRSRCVMYVDKGGPQIAFALNSRESGKKKKERRNKKEERRKKKEESRKKKEERRKKKEERRTRRVTCARFRRLVQTFSRNRSKKPMYFLGVRKTDWLRFFLPKK